MEWWECPTIEWWECQYCETRLRKINSYYRRIRKHMEEFHNTLINKSENPTAVKVEDGNQEDKIDLKTDPVTAKSENQEGAELEAINTGLVDSMSGLKNSENPGLVGSMSGLKPSENDIPKVEPEIVNETSENNSDKIISKNLIECKVLNKSTAEDIVINSDKIISKNLIECEVLNKSTAEINTTPSS